MKVARALVIAVLVLLMAVTPLSALIAPGEYDVRFAGHGSWDPGFIVHLSDRTGLVRALTVAPRRLGVFDPITNYSSDGKILIVELEGSSCDYRAHLTLDKAGTGFRLHTTTQSFGCVIGSGRYTDVAFHLWTPIDASTVEFAGDQRR
ncbi:MAG: hypothetical protein ACR2H0_05520 [Candidatus Limnocylindrales bacterium]